MSESDRESRIEALLLGIDTRLVMVVSAQREIEARLTWIENALRQRPSAEADGAPVARIRRRPTHAQVQRDNAVLDALRAGPLTLTELARVVHRTDQITERETQALWPVLKRMREEGWIERDERKRYRRTERRA